jgi:chemotaxis family two-component system sensor kinase Cph1
MMQQNLDLTACDHEPIHIPGAIQPHGILIAFDANRQTFTHASANVEALWGYSPEQLWGKMIHEFAAEFETPDWNNVLLSDISIGRPLYQASWKHQATETTWDVITHRHLGRIFFEFEPAQSQPASRVDQLYRHLHEALFRLENPNSVKELADVVARHVRQLNGFDRVMVYRFDKDWHGEVIAENRRDGLEPFLGLHYPASDIPRQARALYTSNWLRFITDRDYTPAPILAGPTAGAEALDLSFSVLRSVSPIHLQYLRNMGVAASMSISLLRQGELWGLIACHHYSPRYVPYDLRKACELLGQFMSLHITQVEDAETSRERARLKDTSAKLVTGLEREEDIANAVIHAKPSLLDFIPAAGAAVVADSSIERLGQTPNEPEIRQLAAWLSQSNSEIFSTNHLQGEFGTGILSSVAAGVLAINLGHNRLHQLIWFRPEKIRTVNWAGDPRKFESDGVTPDRLTPRGSFALWRETVRGQSEPWTDDEIAAATDLRQNIVRLMLKRAELLALAHNDLRLSSLEREKALEAERSARLESERLHRVKDDFVATLSHELRTPLNAILGWTQLLQMSDQIDLEELTEGLDVIERNAKSQAAMIEDLLEISRIVSGRLRLDLQDVNLAEIVEDAIESLSVTAAVKKVRLEKMLDPLIGIKATGDPNRLRQIAWNLLSNAIKFTPAKGRVQVVLQKVDSHVELSVADTGIGIKPDFLPHIFERYRQADPSITRQYGGLGLGLAIVRNLVELHGGNITADSAGEGRGATFTVSLPIRIVSQTESPAKPAARSDASFAETTIRLPGLRVCILDDEKDARELLGKIFRVAECDVTCCETADQALDLLARNEFDLIVSDIGMAEMDGYSFIRLWRQRETELGRKRLPAVALTAYARAEDRRRALVAGFTSHITKPVDAVELITLAASMTERLEPS